MHGPTGDNSASVSLNPSATTTYTVTATGSGCILSASYIVNVNNAPPVPTVGSSAATICAGQTVDLTSSTPNNTLTLNYSEGFESGLPTGWVVLNGSASNPNVSCAYNSFCYCTWWH